MTTNIFQFPNRTAAVLTGGLVIEPEVPILIARLLEEAITESTTTTRLFKKLTPLLDTYVTLIDSGGSLHLESTYRLRCADNYAVTHDTAFLEFSWDPLSEKERTELDEEYEDPILKYDDYVQRAFCPQHPILIFLAKLLTQLWLRETYKVVQRHKTEVIGDAISFYFVDRNNNFTANVIYRVSIRILPIILDVFVQERLQAANNKGGA